MARILALLGSINIGGNRVKMVDLKAAFAEEGFQDLVTIAASGNLILTDDRDPAFIETHLERILKDRFGFNSCVMVRSKDQVRSAVDDNPFHGTGEEHGSDKMVHSIFLSQQPKESDFDNLLETHKSKGSERLALGDRVLYLDYIYGVGVSDLSNKYLERHLKVKGTARNMNSLKNILSKMD
ncbi:MAG: DUF1697 domain-containing protein [Erythrobacter sp.]